MSSTSPIKKLINRAEDVVDESLAGLLLQHPSITRIEGERVLLRTDYEKVKKNKVALISGGGSGHEPAHVGYIGEGMLTAVACGDVFASASVSGILAAIRAVTGPQGTLLIVKNYTGDRLAFGQAREQAVGEGLKVDLLTVGEDCALPKSKGITGRRGVAGTCFVHKLAGAAAEAGKSLSEIKEEVEAAIRDMGSLGLALSTCVVPGTTRSDRLDGPYVELGLGIHGEPGIQKIPLEPADPLVDKMIRAITASEAEGGQDYLPLKKGDEVAVLVNNLGSTPPGELNIVARRVVEVLEGKHGVKIQRLFVGTYLTSLEMAGASLTILKTNDKRLQYLDAPTQAPGWIPATPRAPKPTPAVPAPPAPKRVQGSDAYEKELSPEQIKLYRRAAQSVSEAILAHADRLNELDRIGGDGDCGVTLSNGAKGVLAAVKEPDNAEVWRHGPSGFCVDLAAAISSSMGGTAGVLLDLFFRVMGRHLKETKQVQPSALDWAKAMEEGLGALSRYGGARRGYRTMLDALIPANEALLRGEGLAGAVKAANAGAEETKTMGGWAGRANYVSDEQLQGHPDAGAEAVTVAMAALERAVDNK